MYSLYLKKFEENYMLYIPLSIIAQSCLGSAAAMLILQNLNSYSFIQLFLCVSLTMLYNAAILAQQKKSLVFLLLILSLLVNTLLIIINLL